MARAVEIRVKPLWMRLVNREAVVAFLGRAYFPPGMHERLAKEDPERLADILDHEMIHVARQRGRGMIAWHVLYALSRDFRWQEEMAAYHSSLRRLRARGADLDEAARERLARDLSGWKYLFMTSRERARRFVDRVLDEAPAPRGAAVAGRPAATA
jgi:hypothetical protein